MSSTPLFTTRKLAIPLSVALVNILLTALAYGSLPERIIIHWNVSGAPDGYSGKVMVVLMPVVSLFFLGLFLLIPRIDPSDNIGRFGGSYMGLMIVMQLYVLFFNIIFIAQNLGYMFNIATALALAFGVMFFYLGTVLEKAKQNWFVGIRTPWTLSDEEVWDQTHRFGGRLFKLCGVVTLLGALIPDISFWLIILPVALSSMYLVIYSYAEYQKKRK